MVSVIIPTYNRKELVCGAIESVMNQSHKDFELIVIDDGSKDGTKNMLSSFLERHSNRLRYFYQENRGVSAARNKGIEEAKGDYIAFLDSDDFADKDWLKNGIKRFIYQDVGVVCGKTVSLKPSTLAETLLSRYHNKSRLGKSSQGQVNFFIGTNVIFRKSVFEKVGAFDEGFRHGDDSDFNMRVNQARIKIFFAPEAKVLYRHRETLLKLFKQRYGYGYGKILLYRKYPSYRRSIFQDMVEFITRFVKFSLRMLVRIFMFIFKKEKRDLNSLLIHPVLIVCMMSSHLGRLQARLKYNIWF